MPVFMYKFSQFFEGLGHGFSESYYTPQTSDNIETIFGALEPLNAKRAKLLGADHTLIASRLQIVSIDGTTVVRRRGKLKKERIAGTQTTSGGPNPSVNSNTRLQVLWQNSDSSREKLLYMGGVWDSVIEGNRYVQSAPGGFASYFQSWVSYCQQVNLGWNGNNPNPVKYKIVNYVVDPVTALVTFTLAAPGIVWPTFDKPVGITVDFGGLKSALDGSYLVWPGTATTAVTVKPRPSSMFIGPGNLWINTKGFIGVGPPGVGLPPGPIVAQNAMTRKQGRPYYASRGRLPSVVRW